MSFRVSLPGIFRSGISCDETQGELPLARTAGGGCPYMGTLNYGLAMDHRDLESPPHPQRQPYGQVSH